MSIYARDDSHDGGSGLENRTRRNIRIGNRRTSIKLEPEMWDALNEICTRTEKNLNQICTEVHGASSLGDPDEVPGSANFTSELRVFILDFYRAAARHEGPERGLVSLPGNRAEI